MSATLLAPAPATAVQPRSRTAAAATWLFVLPLLAEGVAGNVVKIEVGGLALLAFASIVIQKRGLPLQAAARIYLTVTVLALIVMGYVTFGSWPAGAGKAGSYDMHAALFAVTYVAVAVFAVLFFNERLFQRILWRGATVALWLGIVSCLASHLTGHPLMVNPSNGSLRMVGTLTEPSDWAPLLTLVMLLALRRRSWPYAALAVTGLVLAESPTCMLVMGVTVPLYYTLTGSWRYRVPLLMAMTVLIPAGVLFVQQADPTSWLNSGNATEVAAGRLVVGIQNTQTGGRVGANARYTTMTVVLADARENDWMTFGAGPAADATYFPVEYPGPHASAVAANAIWISVLFDLGEGGVAVLAVMMVVAVWRMRRHPQLAALLLPFFTASLVNSTIPDYSFVALGIMLFAFGWTPIRALGGARDHCSLTTSRM